MNRKQIIRIAQLTLTAVAALTLAGHAEARNYSFQESCLVASLGPSPSLHG